MSYFKWVIRKGHSKVTCDQRSECIKGGSLPNRQESCPKDPAAYAWSVQWPAEAVAAAVSRRRSRGLRPQREHRGRARESTLMRRKLLQLSVAGHAGRITWRLGREDAAGQAVGPGSPEFSTAQLRPQRTHAMSGDTWLSRLGEGAPGGWRPGMPLKHPTNHRTAHGGE